ncbi:MAG: methyl-accepting chemotaxis protein [Spirochaetaceae bacterium]|nr:methyl-accepting chemotaxis protein [Spirochaetaceae bacterium]
MKIGVKFFLMIAVLNLTGTIILFGIIFQVNQNRNNELIQSEITNLCADQALSIRNWFNGYLANVRVLGHILSRYETIRIEERRSLYSLMVKSMVESEPDVIGAAMVWEPNVLDGLDAQYAGSPGSDHTGRFTPYWSKTRRGVEIETLEGYDVPGQGEYYLIPKQTGKELLTGPFVYPIEGEERIMATVTVPIKNKDRFAGVVAMDVGIEVIQRQVETIQPYPGTVAAVYSNSGIVTGHFDPSRIGKLLWKTEDDVVGPYLPEFIAALQQGTVFHFTRYVPALKAEMRFTCFPFSVGDAIAPWSLMIGIPTRAISAPWYRSLWVSLSIGAIMLVLVCVAAFILARSISQPIRHMAEILAEIREGEMTKRLDFQSKDEIGEITLSFNATLDKIQQLIRGINEQAFSLSDMGEDMASSAKAISATAHEQSASVSEIVRTMEGSKKLSEQMACKTEEMARLSLNTQKLSQQGAQLRDANEQMMGDIQNQNGKIIQEIKQVADMIKHIKGAIRIIDGIADQTKLIAFNAALEASASGEKGLRFAVVAGEIRRFADNVVDSTQGIKLKIAEVQTASTALIGEALSGSQKIEAGYAHMSAQKAVFEAIVAIAQNVATRSAQISNLSKQQEYASAQIFEALREISAGLEHYVSATASTEKTADTLNALSQELQQAIAQYRTHQVEA